MALHEIIQADIDAANAIARENCYGPLLGTSWEYDGVYHLPVFYFLSGKRITAYCLPDANGGWRNVFHA